MLMDVEGDLIAQLGSPHCNPAMSYSILHVHTIMDNTSVLYHTCQVCKGSLTLDPKP